MASRSLSSSPNSAAGWGSDSGRPEPGEQRGVESGSGSDPEGDALEHEFEFAAERVRGLVQSASREQLLYLYGRYKQATVGKCNTPKPGFFDFEGQRKWSAWKQLDDMSKEQAMQEYISSVRTLDPEGFKQGSSERRRGEHRTTFGGASVSCLYQQETIREEDKNIFDYCRENNIEQVRTALSANIDINTKDEEGRALLHWACDRGHKELVTFLLNNNANINSQDNEGQTPLHYASACEFGEIVELLLQSGADPSIKDGEGSLPEEVTESSSISSLLRQYSAPKG
ncbi:acyl-CoA-binding domain-containing protein 6 isoform X1 [Clarias gariepinus]|uniref:acyl-CoA-binding domain-containing protein 6 isoform X1 n=1 Tax=Clarias gariepinus TaxID=13013 RepID=UPI00234D2FDF|nr:acyl-CoA-binding domain-containing protein 6 isoform X1 [Clarias gariepinus]